LFSAGDLILVAAEAFAAKNRKNDSQKQNFHLRIAMVVSASVVLLRMSLVAAAHAAATWK